MKHTLLFATLLLLNCQVCKPAAMAMSTTDTQNISFKNAYDPENKRVKELAAVLYDYDLPNELVTLIATYDRWVLPNLSADPKNKNFVTAMALLSSGLLAVGYHDGTIRLWDVTKDPLNPHVLVKNLLGHTGPISVLLTLPTGKLLSGSTSYGSRIARVEIQNSQVTLTSFLAEQEKNSDSRLMIWNLGSTEKETVSEKILAPESKRKYFLCSLSLFLTRSREWFRPREKNFTGTCKRTFDLVTDRHTDQDSYEGFYNENDTSPWAVDTGKYKRTCECELVNFGLIGLVNGAIIIKNKTTAETRSIKGHSAPITTLYAMPYEDCFASGAKDGTICFWNAQTGMCFYMLQTSKPVYALQIIRYFHKDPDGRIECEYPLLFVDTNEGLECLPLVALTKYYV